MKKPVGRTYSAYLHQSYHKEHKEKYTSYDGQCNDPCGYYLLLDIPNEKGGYYYRMVPANVVPTQLAITTDQHTCTCSVNFVHSIHKVIYHRNCVRFEVPTAVTVWSSIFFDITPRSMVKIF
jgi:hypothetical protein